MTIRRVLAVLAAASSLLLAIQPLAPPAGAAGSPWFTETAPLSLSVSGTYTPLVGNFEGDATPDILWYAPGSATDWMWRGLGSGTFAKHPLAQQIGGTYTPIVGDFVSDARPEVLWYAPGSGADALWNFANDEITSYPISISGTYTPHVIPDSRWGPGGGRREKILWLTPGTGGDSLWQFTGPTGQHTSTTLSVAGSPIPVIGDFDGNTINDILWYRPGAEPEQLWSALDPYGNYISSAFQVTGTYTPVVGDFTPFLDTIDDIVWYAPGATSANVWQGTGIRADWSKSTVPFAGRGTAIPLRGEWGYLLLADPAGPDRIWFLQNGIAPYSGSTGNTELGSGYTPIVGDFAGFTPDVLWYKPGKAREILFTD